MMNRQTKRWRSFLVLVCLAGAPSGQSGEISEQTVERTYTSKLTYRCIVSTPDQYAADPQRAWPLILFLHGGGVPDPDRYAARLEWLTELPAIVVAPICPLSDEGGLYTNWNWKMLGAVVRESGARFRVDPDKRSVIGFSMGGSGAWELPFYEPQLFSKSVVIAGVCHPWSLRHYPSTQVWAFIGSEDTMAKEQRETVSSAERFQVDVVTTVWEGANHGGIFRNVKTYRPMLDWLTSDHDLRREEKIESAAAPPDPPAARLPE